MAAQEAGAPLPRYSAAESSFIAEETVVTIVPNLDHPQLQFISGNFGPLQSGLPCQVPLWLALNMRKRGKCTIKVPDWLGAAPLEERVQQEKSTRVLGQLPFFYMEVGHLLLSHAKEDVPDHERVSSLLQDLENIRMDRLRLGIAMTAETVNKDESVVSTALNNIAAMEINAIRDFFVHSMDSFQWLKPPEDLVETSSASRSARLAAGRTALDAIEIQEERPEQAAGGPRKLRKFRNT